MNALPVQRPDDVACVDRKAGHKAELGENALGNWATSVPHNAWMRAGGLVQAQRDAEDAYFAWILRLEWEALQACMRTELRGKRMACHYGAANCTEEELQRLIDERPTATPAVPKPAPHVETLASRTEASRHLAVEQSLFSARVVRFQREAALLPRLPVRTFLLTHGARK